MSEQKTTGEQGDVTDPVCGMKIDPSTTTYRSERRGTIYHFCSARCRKKFITAPELYISAELGQ